MADAMKLVPVEPGAGLMSVIAAMVRRIAVPVSLVPEEIYFDNGHARQIYKAITDAAASPPAREEAPACDNCGGKGYTEYEGGDGEGWPSKPEIEACGAYQEAPAEGAGELKKTMTLNLTDAEMTALEQVMASKDLSAPAVFRNSFKLYQLVECGLASVIHHNSGPNCTDTISSTRTSEPEAGEGFAFWTENLIDIVEGIGSIPHGTWRDEKGKRLKDTTAWAAFYVAARRAHPAPATADKLRVAVEALEAARGHTQLTHVYAGIDAALATLNEQPQ